jgi:hypothetical protein
VELVDKALETDWTNGLELYSKVINLNVSRNPIKLEENGKKLRYDCSDIETHPNTQIVLQTNQSVTNLPNHLSQTTQKSLSTKPCIQNNLNPIFNFSLSPNSSSRSDKYEDILRNWPANEIETPAFV